ncbi:MAG: FGGY family carbohydrate kinase [Alistipes finegoldii]
MKSLGIDIGSSSVKVSLLTSRRASARPRPPTPRPKCPSDRQSGWAEQDPEMWWHYVCEGIRTIAAQGFAMSDVVSVGITYQMHGLVCLDKQAVRCALDHLVRLARRGDRSRSAGRHRAGVLSRAYAQLTGQLHCVETGVGQAQRTRRIRADIQIHAPGDYIAYRLSGRMSTPSAAFRSRYSGTSKRSGGPTSWPDGTAFRRR